MKTRLVKQNKEDTDLRRSFSRPGRGVNNNTLQDFVEQMDAPQWATKKRVAGAPQQNYHKFVNVEVQ